MRVRRYRYRGRYRGRRGRGRNRRRVRDPESRLRSGRVVRRRRPVRKVPRREGDRRDRRDRRDLEPGSVTQPGDPSNLTDDPVRGAGRNVGDDDGPVVDREFFFVFEEGADLEVVADVDVLRGRKESRVNLLFD